MSDETTPEEGPQEGLGIDPDHPWVWAAMNVPLQPIQSAIELDEVELTIEGRKVKAALLAVADAGGVKTAFLPPALLAALVDKGIHIIQEWEKEKRTGLVVAGAGVNVSRIADQIARSRNGQ